MEQVQAFNTMPSLLIALATMIDMVSSVVTGSIAVTLSMFALFPTIFPAVVRTPKNVTAMRHAAVE